MLAHDLALGFALAAPPPFFSQVYASLVHVLAAIFFLVALAMMLSIVFDLLAFHGPAGNAYRHLAWHVATGGRGAVLHAARSLHAVDYGLGAWTPLEAARNDSAPTG